MENTHQTVCRLIFQNSQVFRAKRQLLQEAIYAKLEGGTVKER